MPIHKEHVHKRVPYQPKLKMVKEYPEELKKDWKDYKTGYACMIIQQKRGHLCGYVGIPKKHALFGDRNLFEYYDLDVHGGITFSRMSDPWSGEKTKDVYWIGFDCNHSDDLPLGETCTQSERTYKDMSYVLTETLKLSSQLKSMDDLGVHLRMILKNNYKPVKSHKKAAFSVYCHRTRKAYFFARKKVKA